MIPVSFLSSYEFCPRKLFLERVLKLESASDKTVIKIDVKHEVLKLINDKEEEIVTSIKKRPAYSQVRDLYKDKYADILRSAISIYKPKLLEVNISLIDTFKSLWPVVLREAKTRCENLFEFIAKNEVYGESLWNLLSPKIKSKYDVESENLGLKGVIDQIKIYPDRIIPIDIKNGSAPSTGVWSGQKLQVCAYIMILEDMGEVVGDGFVNYIDHDIIRPVPINPFLRNHVLETRDSIKRLFDEKKIPDFCENKNKCKTCSLKENCYNNTFIGTKMKNLLFKNTRSNSNHV
ncbi:MAG: CRISPR-associated protein Cas4 [Nanoarchaeota archaeon]|nr:CRISPR-associated protein Cas4 [Nanoarchaeota archaeon]MBU1030014.1 CRISPR-associated protein Cas4 [Nanoarchaeota archaeon]MBU1850393.1 CRISPR-associated protein Cas4 [Nanoarchaeota archaeon]